MTDSLDMHVASPEETAAAHRNVFDIWSKGLAVEEHVQFRLTSPKHRLATWYVGCIEGRVVVSLGAYPLRFRIRGQEVTGIAIGSVYTLGDFRRRGFAAQLISWVEQQTSRQGGAVSLLYSDIDPDYYANMGYALCPSIEGWRDPRAFTSSVATTHRLVEIDAASHLERLGQLYSEYHSARPLSIARNAEYWGSLLERFTDDRFFTLCDEHDAWDGYVRLGRQDLTLRITDYALADERATLAEQLYACCLSLARESGMERFGGWLPDTPAARKNFALTPRRTEITMVKSLVAAYPLDEQLIGSTDQFCEIDHV